ncbi:MAG: hypothetical protein ACXVSA_19540 [Solirubrobacteraceae bacterium]
MLKMAGVRLHPGMRVVLGAVLIAVGLARHDATPLLVIGGALLLFGVAGMVGAASGGR